MKLSLQLQLLEKTVMKKERQDETQFTTTIAGKTVMKKRKTG
jgi:hypothetical protein